VRKAGARGRKWISAYALAEQVLYECDNWIIGIEVLWIKNQVLLP
jgi:hypothetical protein